MNRVPQTFVGPYQLLAPIGAGGMGEVWKARDTRLDRVVALKLLPADKLADDSRIRRFTQEARAASALNHPNIVTIHEISPENGMHFIAMEYVQGKTLDQLIPRKGMRLNEALKIAIQIAGALSAAAAAGIIHRDLKPGNIMVTESGLVKVLDFGLAKLVEPTSTDQSSTIVNGETRAETGEGTILGTASYMSPEQAEGKPLDPRSDIFSFGAVLYEMITGQRAFRGESTMSTISAILRDDPKPPSQISDDIPRELERIIARCLRKDRERRFQHMADVRVALLDLKEEFDSGKLLASESPRQRRRALGPVAAGLAAALLIAAGISFLYSRSSFSWRSAPRSAPEPVSVPFTSYAGYQGDPAFSPDGNQIAFSWTGEDGSTSHIYVKMIGTDTSLRLTSGNMNDVSPAWAPDGKSIAFLRELSPTTNGIYTVPPLGGPERRVAEIGRPGSAGTTIIRDLTLTWSRNGKWLLTSGNQAPGNPPHIFVVSTDTGQTRPLDFGDAGNEFWPALSPDSHRLAFSRSLGQILKTDIYTVGLDDDLRPTGTPRRLDLPAGFNGQPAWTPGGNELIFVHSTSGPSAGRLWEVGVDGSHPAQPIRGIGEGAVEPAVAPQDNRLAFQHWFGDINIWRIPITATQKVGQPSALVASTRLDVVRPMSFSPDGTKIAFESTRSGPTAIWIANADGSSPSLLCGGSVSLNGSPAWSPDGRWVVFDTRKNGNAQIYVISADGGVPRRLTHDSFDDMVPYWSHDGKWIYFGSNHGDRFEIYKISPSGGPVVQVTHTGGWSPQESEDGQFLYYERTRGGPSPLLRVPVQGGPEVQILPEVLERSWAITGRGIWFISQVGDRGEVLFFDFKTNRTANVARLGNGLFFDGLAISPDQQMILYNQIDKYGTEILLVENFR